MAKCQECKVYEFKSMEDMYLTTLHGGHPGGLGHPVCLDCLKANHYEQYKEEMGLK
jgi:hypothetical protein